MVRAKNSAIQLLTCVFWENSFFRPSLTSLQGQGAEVGSNFIRFEGMEFDPTSAPCHAGGGEERNPQGAGDGLLPSL